MPELRKNPVIGRWVIISSERGRRPVDFHEPEGRVDPKPCPFCEGNEDKTPPEVFAYRAPGGVRDGRGWTLRVVPNKFPALQIEGELQRKGEGMFDKISGVGAHEVVIETPNHDLTLATMPLREVQNLFWAFKERVTDLEKDFRLRYAMIFKNYGRAAGASLHHSHSQIIVLPIVPKIVQEEIDGSRSYYNYKERCIFCDILQQELELEKRVILQNEDCIAISPYAPCFPFETWILPKQHMSHFEYSPDRVIQNVGKLVKELLLRIQVVLEDPPYNFVLHSLPFHYEHTFFYHWHLEIIPKLTSVAGFEWGTGFYINPTPPEESTRFLRTADISPFAHTW